MASPGGGGDFFRIRGQVHGSEFPGRPTKHSYFRGLRFATRLVWDLENIDLPMSWPSQNIVWPKNSFRNHISSNT